MRFEATAFANMNEDTLRQYNAIMTTELDIIARREFARKEGRAEGLAEGRAEGRAKGRAEGRTEGSNERAKEIAVKMLSKTYPISEIAELTGLSEKEIAALGLS